MTGVPETAIWPAARLGEALAALAGTPLAETAPADPAAVDDWLEWAGARLSFEVLPVHVTPRDAISFISAGGPALIRTAAGFLALAGARRGKAWFETPDAGVLTLPVACVAGWLTEPLAAEVRPEVERVVAAAGIDAGRRGRVAAAMVAERIADETVGGLWLLRRPATGMTRQFAEAGQFRRLGLIAALLVLLYAGEAWGWSLIGSATLAGAVDRGWLSAWLLLLLTLLPMRVGAGWCEAMFTLDTGRLVKTRLLAGALAQAADTVKRAGVGGLIGQVIEAQALEGLALGGGFAVMVALVELGVAAWVLYLGLAPGWHLALLALFVGLTACGALGFHRAIAAWTMHRLALTHHLVEAMIGHRTRLAQERPWRREAGEDARLTDYLASAGRMDRATLRLGNGLGLAWHLAALALLAPGLAGHPAMASLAVSLGGILLAGRALGGVGQGLSSLSLAGIAWRRVAPLFRAGGQPPQPGLAPHAAGATGTTAGPAIEARNLHYAHPGGPAVLAGADLVLGHGDRVLVEGPSGGGKSTLAAILTGQRQPDAGLLLLDGLDRPTLGDDWHRRAASAPQFHENHVFSDTLAFNLLMGRRWPPSPADLAEAESLCRELELGPLLDRMPGGLHQRIGETGWQLSHGERSRVFLARALLQQAPVTVLDESFGALDPATMESCLAATLARAPTLVVIAHP